MFEEDQSMSRIAATARMSTTQIDQRHLPLRTTQAVT